MKAKLRRNQLIAPFGVGALHVLKGSRAVVTGGLDFWFRNATSEQIRCVRVQEPRLQSRLGVGHFRLPPGPETELPGSPSQQVPLFRFPTWFVCPRCHQMDRRNLGMDGEASCSNPSCTSEIMRQISFAAVCDYGHLQDFPWREWVHHQRSPDCNKILTYHAGGSGSLADIQVRCGCEKSRDLQGIMSGDMPDHESKDPSKKEGWSFLTSSLLAPPGRDTDVKRGPAAEKFYCQGGRPWLGEPEGCHCMRPLRAVLINATNVHYAQVQSALWIPPGGQDGRITVLRKKMDEPEIRARVELSRSLDFSDEQIADNLLERYQTDLRGVGRDLLLQVLSGGIGTEDGNLPAGLTEEESLRYPEFLTFQESRTPETSEEFLEVRLADVAQLSEILRTSIESISLVDRLRETRVMNGFTRLVPFAAPDAPRPSSHLWKNQPEVDSEKWLPASLVFGEGIFVSFAEDPLHEWERKDEVTEHFQALQLREDAAARRMGRESRAIFPRFVLLHSLAHLLMRRLSFECGYGSASLRERLYVSTKPEIRMAGLLIYTASGDSEGSMGGLVRMGEPENFSRMFAAALDDARWCSADPVCLESGLNGGQGIDGLNIAACHCCTLVPETSCEFFNCYLDRSVVVQSNTSALRGFFE